MEPRQPVMGALARAAALVASLGVMAALYACRIAPSRTRWVEAHGRAELRQIAASSRGVDGLGVRAGLYHYPGFFATAWPLVADGVPVAIAASDDSTYSLSAGEISRFREGRRSVWRSLSDLSLEGIYSGPDADLYAISGGQPLRLSRHTQVPLPCLGPAQSLAAFGPDVYVLNQDGSVNVVRNEVCESLPLAMTVSSLTINRRALYFVHDGSAFEKRGDAITQLPAPQLYRDSERRATKIATVSASNNTVWGLSTEGFVFQLVYP